MVKQTAKDRNTALARQMLDSCSTVARHLPNKYQAPSVGLEEIKKKNSDGPYPGNKYIW